MRNFLSCDSLTSSVSSALGEDKGRHIMLNADDIEESSTSSEDVESHKGSTQAVDLTTDVFGLFMLRAVQVVDPLWGGSSRKQALKACHTCVVYAVTVIVQFVMSGVLYMRADTMESSVENHRFVKDFHMSIAEASSLLNTAVQTNASLSRTDYEGMLNVCAAQLEMQVTGMYPMMIFVWFAIMIQELHLVADWVFHLWRMPITSLTEIRAAAASGYSEPGLIQKDATGKNDTITKLTPSLKFVVVVSNPVVRLLIAVLVGYSGAKYLLLMTHDLKVFVKALCMKFVLDIDVFMLNGFTTPNVRKELSMAQLVYPRPELDKMEKGEKHWWNSGLGGFVFLFLDLGLVYLIVQVIFGDLTSFRHACRAYNAKFPDLLGVPRNKNFIEALESLLD